MSFPLRPRTHLVAAATMAVTLAGCSATETTSTTSTAMTDDAVSTSDGTASTDGAKATDGAQSTDDSTNTSDASAATLASDQAAATSQGPPTTVEADAEAFNLEVPAGWKDVIETAPEGTVLAAQSTTRTGGSFNTLVVTTGDSVTDLDEVVAASIETLEDDEDADVTSSNDIDIDGEPAYGFTTTTPSGGDSITNQLRYVNFGGSLYTVTFSSSAVEGETSDVANQEFEDILDSWSWSDRG